MYLFYKLQIEPKALKFCDFCVTELLAYRLGREGEGGGGLELMSVGIKMECFKTRLNSYSFRLSIIL